MFGKELDHGGLVGRLLLDLLADGAQHVLSNDCDVFLLLLQLGNRVEFSCATVIKLIWTYLSGASRPLSCSEPLSRFMFTTSKIRMKVWATSSKQKRALVTILFGKIKVLNLN